MVNEHFLSIIFSENLEQSILHLQFILNSINRSDLVIISAISADNLSIYVRRLSVYFYLLNLSANVRNFACLFTNCVNFHAASFTNRATFIHFIWHINVFKHHSFPSIPFVIMAFRSVSFATSFLPIRAVAGVV